MKVNLTKLWSDTYDGFIASATKQLSETKKGKSETKPAQQKGYNKKKGKPNESKPQADKKKEYEDTAWEKGWPGPFVNKELKGQAAATSQTLVQLGNDKNDSRRTKRAVP